MLAAVYAKLAVIFGAVALGWLAASRGWLGGLVVDAQGRSAPSPEVGRILSAVVFTVLIPALLLRTMARMDLAHMPWRTLAAFLAPLLLYTLAVYIWKRRAMAAVTAVTAEPADPATPATHAITASYGNAVQLGIPVAAALYGEAGLALHLAIVSVHGVLLLLMLTVLVELDLARARGRQQLAATLRTTARQLVVHPVVLPVTMGLAWNLTGFGLHPLVDELLRLLGQAAIPVCLLLIGIALATYGLRGAVRAAMPLVLLKLLVLPALVLVTAHGLFGLRGMPLGVLVIMAALPAGANALIFSQRYGAALAETTAAIVISTLGFVAAASLWLGVLAALGSAS